MTARQAYIDSHSHPSVSASMEDFEAREHEFSPTFPSVPSHHSGFRSPNASEFSEGSRRSYSPPAWRKSGSGWFKHPSLSPQRSGFESKEPSPQYHDAEEEGDLDLTAYRLGAGIPLPISPVQGRSTRNTPEPGIELGRDNRAGGDATMSLDAQSDSPATLPVNESNCKQYSMNRNA